MRVGKRLVTDVLFAGSIFRVIFVAAAHLGLLIVVVHIHIQSVAGEETQTDTGKSYFGVIDVFLFGTICRKAAENIVRISQYHRAGIFRRAGLLNQTDGIDETWNLFVTGSCP